MGRKGAGLMVNIVAFEHAGTGGAAHLGQTIG
jgi:hypothetical protein